MGPFNESIDCQFRMVIMFRLAVICNNVSTGFYKRQCNLQNRLFSQDKLSNSTCDLSQLGVFSAW